MRSSARPAAIAAINAAAVIFGSAALFGRLALPVAWIVAGRTLFAVVGLSLWQRRLLPVMPVSRALRLPLGVSALLLAAHWLLFFAAVQRGGVALGTLTFATFPLFTLLGESWVQRRRPGPGALAAVLTILVAVGILVGRGAAREDAAAAALGLLSAVTYAAYWRVGATLGDSLPSSVISWWQNATITVLLLPLLAIAPPGPELASAWPWLAWFGLVNTALALHLYQFALRQLAPTTCSGFIALEPVYAIALSALLFADRIPARVLISGLLIVLSCLALLRAEAARGGAPPAD